MSIYLKLAIAFDAFQSVFKHFTLVSVLSTLHVIWCLFKCLKLIFKCDASFHSGNHS